MNGSHQAISDLRGKQYGTAIQCNENKVINRDNVFDADELGPTLVQMLAKLNSETLYRKQNKLFSSEKNQMFDFLVF